jgi:outer membrane protein
MEAFNVERSEFEEELAQAQSQMLKSLLAKADATIKVLAEQEGFDFVVQEAVYIKPAYDLTARVLEKMR